MTPGFDYSFLRHLSVALSLFFLAGTGFWVIDSQ
jgi:hypothetical protein